MRRGDRGSAVAEFVMVSALVLALFMVVFQVGLALHARNVLVSVAADGARFGANADVSSVAAVQARVRDGIATAFSSGYAAQAVISASQTDGIVEVRIDAPFPIAFVPAGPIRFTVEGHALEESPVSRRGASSRPGLGRLRPTGDGGNALVEFVVLSVVLMMPLVYVMLGVFDTQRTSFGVTEAARQAGRTWITSGCDRDRARRAGALALADQGVALSEITFPAACPGPGQRGTVRVKGFVQLRGFGALLPAGRGGFYVGGSFVAVRDRFDTTVVP